jgi:hypothetical protein
MSNGKLSLKDSKNSKISQTPKLCAHLQQPISAKPAFAL